MNAEIKIDAIDTGYFYADGGAMFGAVPKTAWQRRYICNEENRCILSMRSLLVRTPDQRKIVIDNGAGEKHLETLSYYQFFNLKDMGNELKDRGVNREEITDVILTHLHFDHCGYTTIREDNNKDLTLAFPNATHWISQAQWDNLHNPNPLEKDAYFKEDVDLIEKMGKLEHIRNDREINSVVKLKLYDGHTRGQIVPYIHTHARTFIFPGDVIPLAANVSPDWISAYDTFPVTSLKEKCRLLEEAVKEQQLLIYCHDAYTICSSVKKIRDFYKAGPAYAL